jgi:hypothetical protein
MSQQKLIPVEEFDRAWNRFFMRDPPLPHVLGATPHRAHPFKIEDLVRESIRELRQELGRVWLPNRFFGTRLHTVVRRKLEAITPLRGWVIAAEQPLRTFVHLPTHVAQTSLEQYLATQAAHLAWVEKDLKRVMKNMKTLVGDLQPDLVIQGPGLVSTVWDLTARERTEHVAKTILYATILARPNQLIQIGETHWDQRGGF